MPGACGVHDAAIFGGLNGSIFFADFASRWIARLDPANGNAAYAFANIAGNPVDMIVGADGALYVLAHGGSTTRISSP